MTFNDLIFPVSALENRRKNRDDELELEEKFRPRS